MHGAYGRSSNLFFLVPLPAMAYCICIEWNILHANFESNIQHRVEEKNILNICVIIVMS